MNNLKSFIQKLNEIQKAIVSFFLSTILFLIFYAIASDVSSRWDPNWKPPHPPNSPYYDMNVVPNTITVPFDFNETWWVWTIYLILIASLLLALYSHKNSNNNKK
ncbi:hypothetical protein QO206_11185 [Leeuwenhoekiella aequorea]|uniref:hypothetical protein n=1 Tax=Leeuwenhoekiella aequorea TaxID=283736 RepID=UPI00352C20AA|tara:strand:+ start:3659 stop:3973 length:315 start_codon:yes stop_codon:yes gene_type:complete